MWTAVLYALLVAAASAEYGWKPNTEYRYEVHSKTLTSLNQVSDLYTGVLMKAEVVITPKTAEQLTIQIPTAQYSKVEANFPQGAEFHTPQEYLKYQPLPLTKQPFEVKLKNGVVDEIVVSKEVPIWEVNVIKSIVSQIQVDTQGQRLIPSKLNMVPQGENEVSAVYKIMEDTVEGECEVLYDVTPLPQYVLQSMPHLVPQPQLVGHGHFIDIVKTKNFTNCMQRPAYHFGFTGLTPWEPTSNSMGSFFSRSSVSRIVISGNLKSYTIQSSVTTNKVILSPELYNSQKGEVFSRVNFTLISVHSSQGEQPECKNPQTIKKLVYDFNSPWTNDQEARNRWDQQRGSYQGSQTGRVYVSGESNERTSPHARRSGRSINENMEYRTTGKTKKQYASSSSESSESISVEDWHQDTPKMTNAPDIPFLPYFVGYMGHSIQHSNEVNVNQVVKKYCQEIGQQLQEPNRVPEKNTLDRFNMLTRVIQTMNFKQLQQATQELYVKTEIESENPADVRYNSWTAFRDAVVQAGTGPALVIIKEWILNGQIQEEQAAQVVANLPKTVVYPSVEYMNTFFEIVKNPQVVQQSHLNTSAIYAFTTLVRMAQVDRQTSHNYYPVHTFGRLIPKDSRVVVDQYIPYFAQQLQSAVQQQDSERIQVYIRALGNMAHPKVLRVFEPYLEKKEQVTDYQRTLIVVSLLKLTKTHPRLARSVLYKVYANVDEVYPVRVAAVYNLMKTNPPASMLQRMAQFTHEDPSNEVSAAVKSVITSYATLTEKDKQQQRENAQSAVDLLTPKEFSLKYSYANVTDYVVRGLNLGYTQYLYHTGNQNTVIPRSFLYYLTRNINGYKYITDKFSGMISSVRVLSDVLEDMVEFGQGGKTHEKGSNQGKYATLEEIYKTVHFEKEFNKQFEANAVFNWAGATRLATFDNHTVENYLYKLQGLLQRCQNKRNFKYQTFYNQYTVTIGMPTASGFPFLYTLTTPTLFSVKAAVKAQIQPQPGKQNVFVFPEKIGVDADISFQYSTRTQSKITFITPFDHQHYIAGVDNNLQLYFPFKTKIGIDTQANSVAVHVSPFEKENQMYSLFHVSSWPYICRHDILGFQPIAEDPNIHRIKIREPIKFVETVGEHTGVTLLVQGYTEKRFFDLKTLYDLIESHTLTSIYAYPTESYTIQQTAIEVVLDPSVCGCKDIVFTANYLRNVKPTQGTQSAGGVNLAVPTDSSVNSRKRLTEFLEKVIAEVKDAEGIAVDLGLDVQGQTPVQYVATVAYSSSPVDEKARFLVYLRQMKNQKNYEVCVNGLNHYQSVPQGNSIKAVEIEPKSVVQMKVSLGEKCQQTESQFDITGKFRRTPERTQYLKQLPLYTEAQTDFSQGYLLEPAQQKLIQEAEVHDNYQFAMKYKHIPEEMKNFTYKAYGILRHVFFPYVSENLFGEKTKQGEAEMIVQFSPDLESLSTYIYTPYGGASFQNVRVPKYVAKIVTPRRVKNTLEVVAETLLQGKYQSTCNFDNNVVRTFGNFSYPLQTGNVWHVAMITKSYLYVDNRYNTKNHIAGAVLVREGKQGLKELQIISESPNTDVVKVLPVQDGKVYIEYNGQRQEVPTNQVYNLYDERGNLHLKFYQVQTGEVVLEYPEHDIAVLYLGKSVRIYVGPQNMKAVVGLCGVRGGQVYEFVTPQGYVVKDPEQFTATWALSNEGRIGQLRQEAQQYSTYRKVNYQSNIVSEQDAGRANFLGRKYQNLVNSAQDYDSSSSSESNESSNTGKQRKVTRGSSGCETRRIVVVENGNKHCFSLNPEPACTSQCHPEATETKTGQFYCVEQSETSKHWEKMIARGANPDFRNKGNAETISFEYPVKCTRN